MVRIRGRQDQVVGAGFLVRPDLLCTCAHVVSAAVGHDADAATAPDARVTVDFPLLPGAPGSTRPAREAEVVTWLPEQPDGGGDLALLRLTGTAPEGARHVPLLHAASLWDRAFRALGFPGNRDFGVWASGRLLGTQAVGWVQMEVGQGPRITYGFSGAPVWDAASGAVAGMVVAAERADGTAYLMPVAMLARLVPEVFARRDGDQDAAPAEGIALRDGGSARDERRRAVRAAGSGTVAAALTTGGYLALDPSPHPLSAGLLALGGAGIGALAAGLPGLRRAPGAPPTAVPPVTAAELDRVLLALAARHDPGGGGHLPEDRSAEGPPMRDHGFEDDPSKALASSTALFQLPPAVADFTGREAALAAVREAVLGAEGEARRAVLISAVAGMGGVGKTTLAVRVAHDLLADFPDGQLYVNLRGAEAQRLDPSDALAEFLRALGVQGAAIPASLDARSRLFRERLAGRRVLVVLDNAADETQVRPLLPGSPGCAVIVTSRARMAGLEGVRPLSLDVLPAEEAVDLLARVAGADRVAEDPEAALRLVRLCGCLPLAVRIAGARLAGRPHWRTATLADRLADEDSRLRELEIGDLGVRASIRISVDELAPPTRRLFRMLGTLTAPDFPAWIAAALLDTDLVTAGAEMERLVDAELLQDAGTDAAGQTRYRFHDLIRAYAREELRASETDAARAEALLRVVEAYLLAARRAVDELEPAGLQSAWRGLAPAVPAAARAAVDAARSPTAWFGAERLSLVSTVEQAHGTLPDHAWELSTELATFFDLHTHWDDWENTQALALSAAQRVGSRVGAGYTLWGVIRLRRYQSRWDEAISAAEQCLGIFRETGDQRGEAAALVDLARVYWYQARFDEAARASDRCLRIFEDLGDRRWRARTLVDLGDVRRDQGRFDEARAHCASAIAVFEELGDARWAAISRVALGRVDLDSGQPDSAVGLFETGLGSFRGLGDRIWENYTLRCMGDALRELGRLDEALTCLLPVVPAFERLGDRRWQMRSLHSLGEVHRVRDEHDAATDCLLACLPAFRANGDRLWEARTLSSLGLLAERDASDEARVLWRAALSILDRIGSPEAAAVRAWLHEDGS